MEFTDELARLIETSGAESVGLACHDLENNSRILVGADEPFHPASTIKICVLMEVFHQSIPLDLKVRVENRFESVVDESPYSIDPLEDSDPELHALAGQWVKVRNLIERMITVSGNLATNLLLQRVGAASVTQFMADLGAPDVHIIRGVEDGVAFRLGINNRASARGLMELLVRLAQLQVVSPAASLEMIEVLKRQRFREGIPAGLPSNVDVANKTGWITNHYHDVAIVYPKGTKPYVLAILTRGLAGEDAGPAFVSRLSRVIYSRLRADGCSRV